jgi:hypothetical protein
MPTIYEVAKRARVSTATVSRILNQQSPGSPSTRRRVMRNALPPASVTLPHKLVVRGSTGPARTRKGSA